MRPYDTREYRAARAKVQGLPCHYCGAPPPSQAHHVHPVLLGGANDLSNIMPACSRCNIAHRDAVQRVLGGRSPRGRRRGGRRQRNERFFSW